MRNTHTRKSTSKAMYIRKGVSEDWLSRPLVFMLTDPVLELIFSQNNLESSGITSGVEYFVLGSSR